MVNQNKQNKHKHTGGNEERKRARHSRKKDRWQKIQEVCKKPDKSKARIKKKVQDEHYNNKSN